MCDQGQEFFLTLLRFFGRSLKHLRVQGRQYQLFVGFTQMRGVPLMVGHQHVVMNHWRR